MMINQTKLLAFSNMAKRIICNKIDKPTKYKKYYNKDLKKWVYSGAPPSPNSQTGNLVKNVTTRINSYSFSLSFNQPYARRLYKGVKSSKFNQPAREFTKEFNKAMDSSQYLMNKVYDLIESSL